MTSDDKPQFVALVAKTAEFYNKALSSASFDIYWQVLDRYTLNALKKAIRDHISEKDRGRFMPLPADIIFQIEGELNAALAWTNVCYAMRVIGAYYSVVFDDPRLHSVIIDMGGWISFCETQEKQLPFVQKDFERRYQYYLRYFPEEYPNVLTGRIDHQNLYLGYPCQDPVFIGHQERAGLVYLRGAEPNALRRFRIGTLDINRLLSNHAANAKLSRAAEKPALSLLEDKKFNSIFNPNHFIPEKNYANS